ncbi:hypothetical protein CEXT_68391 [Caerostris extrusa]|uniref:Uncharacterized protein n=1 Tax=Caerostris extrusa TaxID=172846 RepID=A0AAV4UPN1_CAEEX|nr:hypothetical protein CEXT_68391 [Caerostris extrusa]
MVLFHEKCYNNIQASEIPLKVSTYKKKTATLITPMTTYQRRIFQDFIMAEISSHYETAELSMWKAEISHPPNDKKRFTGLSSIRKVVELNFEFNYNLC